ncbi:helix-turn-helix domain-containing protein [Kaistella sp. G5-32]|uniref:Helix-turn-helix domain-containing protein n=1 Tax=Kaistella gelatinilytica TaxID=2787636 RepID=A0ABS0F7U1_9FLAO|nr:helix-turn-helix domain-containing protein [Kaistella gelatinilytica]MBF8455769.1 helix-turn-helix domain-containing protein [Kaistella gelatinilytica]
MSELKKIREHQNLTQEELAQKSGLSVRTIQRIESGMKPKGFTLKALAASLEVPENDLLVSAVSEKINELDEVSIVETASPVEKGEILNVKLIKIINLSSLPFSWFPIANFLPPILLMLIMKQTSEIIKQIISLQIFLAIIFPILFMILIFLKLGKESVIIGIIVLTLANIYIILRNAYEIDKRQKLFYKLNFSLL